MNELIIFLRENILEEIKAKKYLILSILLNILLFICLMLNCSGTPEPKIEYVPVHDTVSIEKERLVERTKIIYKDTLLQVDSVSVTPDGTYVLLPVTYGEYKDTIKTDSTSAEILIKYHGIGAELDTVGLVYNYFNKREVYIKDNRRIHPYLGLAVGPKLNAGFREINAISTEIRAGLIFKNGWGGEAVYELDIETGGGFSHGVKLGVIKQF